MQSPYASSTRESTPWSAPGVPGIATDPTRSVRVQRVHLETRKHSVLGLYGPKRAGERAKRRHLNGEVLCRGYRDILVLLQPENRSVTVFCNQVRTEHLPSLNVTRGSNSLHSP